MLDIFVKSNATNVSGHARIVVYRPKKAGTVWPGLATNQIVDPNDHTVLLDRIIQPQTGSTSGNGTNDRQFFNRYRVNLRNMITSYDTQIRKGDIKIAILTEAESTAWIMDVRLMLKYQNM